MNLRATTLSGSGAVELYTVRKLLSSNSLSLGHSFICCISSCTRARCSASVSAGVCDVTCSAKCFSLAGSLCSACSCAVIETWGLLQMLRGAASHTAHTINLADQYVL